MGYLSTQSYASYGRLHPVNYRTNLIEHIGVSIRKDSDRSTSFRHFTNDRTFMRKKSSTVPALADVEVFHLFILVSWDSQFADRKLSVIEVKINATKFFLK